MVAPTGLNGALASHSGTHNRADYITQHAPHVEKNGTCARLIPHCCEDPRKTGQTKLKTLHSFWERGGLLVLLFTAKLQKVEGRFEYISFVAISLLGKPEASCLPLAAEDSSCASKFLLRT